MEYWWHRPPQEDSQIRIITESGEVIDRLAHLVPDVARRDAV